MGEALPFVCLHADPRCEDDPCPWGIARVLCNAPADHPLRSREVHVDGASPQDTHHG